MIKWKSEWVDQWIANFNVGITLSIKENGVYDKEANKDFTLIAKSDTGEIMYTIDGIPSLEDAKLFAEKELIKYLVNEIGGEIVEFKGQTYFAKF